jgi:hypothetical protein
MRILRGLSSRFLTCGCLVGVYETYDGQIVNILDARTSACDNPEHQTGKPVPIDSRSAPDGSSEEAVSHRARAGR